MLYSKNGTSFFDRQLGDLDAHLGLNGDQGRCTMCVHHLFVGRPSPSVAHSVGQTNKAGTSTASSRGTTKVPVLQMREEASGRRVGMVACGLGAKGDSNLAADTRERHTVYPLNVCELFHGVKSEMPTVKKTYI